MAQFGRPSSDITALGGGGSGTFTAIDETTFSDTDYISSNDNTSVTYECLLSPLEDPSSSISHTIRWRQARADGNVVPSSGGTASSYSAYLYQGGTLIATLVSGETSNEGSFLAKSYTLTAGEADSITNYADLRIRFNFSASGGSPANRRGVAISWAEMETPDAPATNYQTTYSKGSFTEIGKITSLLLGKVLTSNKGTFTEIGKTVNLLKGKTLSALKGTFTETGKDTSLTYVRAFALTSSKGTFSETGKVISLLQDRNLPLPKGSFTETGKVTNLNKGNLISASKGLFTKTGKIATFTYVKDFTLTASKGTFSETGKIATFTYVKDFTLTASKGTFSETGKAVNFLQNRNLYSLKGVFIETGKPATLDISTGNYVLICSKGVITVLNKNVSLHYQLNVDKILLFSVRSILHNGKKLTYNG